MGQEFFINSQQLENKIRSLLPSQGGAGAGFDLSASTQIIPIVDLTQSAEGSGLPDYLQIASSHDSATSFEVENTTSTIINNTGFWRIIGTSNLNGASAKVSNSINITDGATSKVIWTHIQGFRQTSNNFDFILKLEAGDSLTLTSSAASCFIAGSVRQIADVNGELIAP